MKASAWTGTTIALAIVLATSFAFAAERAGDTAQGGTVQQQDQNNVGPRNDRNRERNSHNATPSQTGHCLHPAKSKGKPKTNAHLPEPCNTPIEHVIAI